MNMMTTPSSTLKQAAHQWMTRPDDQRFTSLPEMLEYKQGVRQRSRALALASSRIQANPVEGDDKALVVVGPGDVPSIPTHWAFGQLCGLSEMHAPTMRKLPGDLASDCLNYGLSKRGISDVGALLRVPEGEVPSLGALTGPNYGRVWDADIIAALINQFGDGVTGDWRVPGVGNVALDEVTTENTLLFASDRDMFVFLADEINRVEIAGRRDGRSGTLSRGAFFWNSEVGSQALGISTFYYDHVCGNRWVMGARGVEELRIRHTASAPEKFIEEVTPAMESYRESSAAGIDAAIKAAQARRIGEGTEEAAVEFIAKRTRFSKTQAKAINMAHWNDEQRPIETLWDVGTAITAYARGVKHQDARIEVEREAGKLLEAAC